MLHKQTNYCQTNATDASVSKVSLSTSEAVQHGCRKCNKDKFTRSLQPHCDASLQSQVTSLFSMLCHLCEKRSNIRWFNCCYVDVSMVGPCLRGIVNAVSDSEDRITFFLELLLSDVVATQCFCSEL